ncbi:MAG: cobalamin-dependent protein [Proteobacteria bacterium]|nr:cobalamin-dependent protein [Pseudomonadota bacterium]MBU1059166.1 cobalamin-dependent protein [Pseudomonadota bacterium]
MKVLLISPNTLTVPYPVYPIGLDYVAGCLAAEHQVEIADLNIIDREGLASLLLDFSPDIIGLSLRNVDNTEIETPLFFIEEYKELVAWLRARSQAVLVCGGAGFTILPQEIFAALDLDYGIIGEGERFGLLVDALANKHSLSDIPGLLSHSGPAQVPAPWTGKQQRHVPRSTAHYQFYLDHGGMLNLQTKRGCSFRCIYCPYPHIEGKTQRLLPPDEVARTALGLEQAGAKYFFITDSIFNSDIGHSLAVAKAFQQCGVSIPWGGFFAPLKLPKGYFKTMHEAGLKHVEFGTESLCRKMLQNYRKPFQPEDVLTAHRQALDAELHVAHYFLMGGPGESENTVQETLTNIASLNKTVLFFFTGIRIYPHTALYDLALAEDQISATTDLLKPVFYESDAITHQAIEKAILHQAGKRINWIVGSGGTEAAATVSKMHQRGYTGPLWEYLIR